MNIYKLQKNLDRKGERKIIPVKTSALKRAAGGEDIVILSEEAMERFRRDSSAKDREEYLKELALQHINDYNPEFENPWSYQEFRKAEKLALLAELVIRTAIPAESRISYEKGADFVADQLTRL